MIVLFELYKYDKALLERILPREYISYLNNPNEATTEYVGYCHFGANSEAKDYVLILPKIFVDEVGLAFGKYKPEIFSTSNFYNSKYEIDRAIVRFINEMSCWIYKSLLIYQKRNENESDLIGLKTVNLPQVVSRNNSNSSHSLLDIYLAFVEFSKKNSNLFISIIKNSNKGSCIKWEKTVTKTTPIMVKGTPIYRDLKTKQRAVSHEDELLSIYYSVLYYFKTYYNFDIRLTLNYKIIKGNKFTSLLDGKGIRLLKKIKNRYFSDTFKKLWNLLYLFFDYESKCKATNNLNEVLVTKYYPAVFEDMIDSLLGDNIKDSVIPTYYKDQKDGRIVDHIYSYKDLLNDSNIYYIGDSKYYQQGHNVVGASLDKQFTYAKNVIQYNIDDENRYENRFRTVRYRDDLTEGYNITPNFFISAFLNSNLDLLPDLHAVDQPITHYHFKDRLFDRDTLTVQRYNINFLFVLVTYISKDEFFKNKFKDESRRKFRKEIISFTNNSYYFFKVYANTNISLEMFVERNFKKLNGKMYYNSNCKNFIIVALSKKCYQSLGDAQNFIFSLSLAKGSEMFELM